MTGQNPSTPQKKWAPKVKESSNPYSSVTTFKRRTGQADSLVHPGCGEGRSALPACARGAPKISRVCLFSKYWSKSPKTPKSEHQNTIPKVEKDKKRIFLNNFIQRILVSRVLYNILDQVRTQWLWLCLPKIVETVFKLSFVILKPIKEISNDKIENLLKYSSSFWNCPEPIWNSFQWYLVIWL